MATLEQLVETRKKQADKREIFAKSQLVVKVLGVGGEEQRKDDPHCVAYIYDWTFNSNGLVIKDHNEEYHYDDGSGGGGSLTVSFSGKEVYKYGNGLEIYKPGKWEGQLDVLYARALEVQKANKAKEVEKAAVEQAVKARELRKNFGL